MMKIFQFLLLATVCAAPMHAANGESPVTQERTEKALETYRQGEEMEVDDNFYGELWNILFALVVIIALMIAGSWFLRRFMQGRMEQMNVSSTIKILEQRNLSTKSVLYIVEVYDKHVLVGESAAGVAPLAEFPIEDETSFQDLMEKK